MIWLQFVYCVAVIMRSGGDAYTKSPWFPCGNSMVRSILLVESRDACGYGDAIL